MKARASSASTINAVRQRGERTREAIRTYSEGSAGKDDDPSVLLAAGKLAMTTPDGLGQAIELLREAFARDPGLHEARAFLALCQLKAGFAEAALDTAAALVFTAPDFVFATRLGSPTSAQTVLGDALFQNERTGEAIAIYERASKLEPRDQHAVRRLASLYLTSGRAGEAAGLLDRIEETDEVRTLVAALRLAANDPDKLPAIVGIPRVLYPQIEI